MNVNDILTFNTQILFIALSVLALADLIRRGGARRRDFFLFAFALGFPLGVTFLRRFIPLESGVLDLAGAFALFSQPYFLFRLLQYYCPGKRSIGLLILAGFLLCCILLLNRMAAAPALTVTIIFSFCAAAEAYTTWGFYQGARGTSGTLRRRLMTITISSAVFTVAFMINAIKAQFPALGITPIAQAAAAASAILFYAAFIPPRWLRRAWQMEELRGYLSLPRIAETDDFVGDQLQHLSQTAKQVTNGLAAGVWNVNGLSPVRPVITVADQSILDQLSAIEPAFIKHVWESGKPTYQIVSSLSDSGLRQQLQSLGIRTWLLVPIRNQDFFEGVLIVALRDRSLFVDEDLDFLDLLTQECVLVLHNHRLIDQLQASLNQLKSTVEERQRITRDLHDAVTQTLFSATIIAEALPKVLPRDPERGIEQANLIGMLNRAMMAEMRTLLQELHPEMLAQTSLSTMLQQLIDATRGRKHLEANVVIEGSENDIPSEVRVVFYRVSQECINNIVKHSGATAYSIHLQVGHQSAQLQIHDNGKGFDPESARDGSGLAVMQERAKAIGATVNIESHPHAGTTVSVIWQNASQAAA